MGDSGGESEASQVSNSVSNCYVRGSVIQFRDQHVIDTTELARQFVAEQQAFHEAKERQEREAAFEAALQANEAEKLQAARHALLLRQRRAKEAERKRQEAARAAERKQEEVERKEGEARASCLLVLVGLAGAIGLDQVSGFPWPLSGVLIVLLWLGWLAQQSS